MWKTIKTISIAFLVLLVSCKEDAPQQQKTKLSIVCTTNILGNTLENLVDTSAVVTTLMGPGVDPHLYRASQGDISALRDADIIIYNGLHLEGKMIDVLEKMSSYKKVIDFSSGCDSSLFIKTADFTDSYDPHIWFDLELWKQGSREIVDKLKNIDNEHIESYKQNLALYITRIDSLDAFVKNQIKQIPDQQRTLITAHDAFNYFGKRYGIEVRGLQGISTQAEFGLKDRIELVNYIIENNIKAIFVESSVSKRNIASVIEGCEAKGHTVVIGGSLYSDALGAKDTPEGTYEGMIKHNVFTIVNALK